jgi:hypothetical protein
LIAVTVAGSLLVGCGGTAETGPGFEEADPVTSTTTVPTTAPPTTLPSTTTSSTIPASTSTVPVEGLRAEFADSEWNGSSVPSGQQCSYHGGTNPSTPQILVSDIPEGSTAIVLEFSDRDWGPMDNGGHGKIGYTVDEGTSEVLIPTVRANTFNLPDGFFLVREHQGPASAGEPGAYMPPCSGGLSNAYYVTIKAVELVAIEEGTFNEIEETILELGRY